MRMVKMSYADTVIEVRRVDIEIYKRKGWAVLVGDPPKEKLKKKKSSKQAIVLEDKDNGDS